MEKSFPAKLDFTIDAPFGSVLGINYSGMHDSSIAIVSPEGIPVFAVSLERISRIKQDGRQLDKLLDAVPWDRIDKVAISAPEFLNEQERYDSKLLSGLLPNTRRAASLVHGEGFYRALDQIPCEKIFVGHQDAHAASVFWGSGFEDALCLTYDGGMFNDNWFGGLFHCSKIDGIQPLDRFDARFYAKVTTLYSFVTALLGFSPLRHEGKITGLAAYGKPTDRCRAILKKWYEENYYELEETIRWLNMYDDEYPPRLVADSTKLRTFRSQIEGIGKEELAATVQDFAESHIVQIISNARTVGWNSENICLAGGLFANVKINQKIVETGFNRLFVAPPMTDDGTALGAAWHVASRSERFNPQPLKSMSLGPAYSKNDALNVVNGEGVNFFVPDNPAETIAELLAQGMIVAVFQGAAEFGPRALGNRSILAQAIEKNINQSLNDRLNRTEFMPFAPMTRVEDADLCYYGIEHVRHAAEFMTVTVNCTDLMKETCPAVVHIDGTARPQLVSAETNPFIHEVLTCYKKISNQLAIVNTSFNVHEEPIVCSVRDALRGFFESGLDYLYLEGVGLISFSDNTQIAIRFLQEKIKLKVQRGGADLPLEQYLELEISNITGSLEKVSSDLIVRTHELVETRESLVDRTEQLEKVSSDLIVRTHELVETRESLVDRTEQLEKVSSDLIVRTHELVETRESLVDRTEQLEKVSSDLIVRTHELVETRASLVDRTTRLEKELQKDSSK
jgi:carbamoyltransferase